VALMAMRVGKASLPDFSHRFSPKTYTGPQLFTCLALKAFFQTDFRGIVALLADRPDLCHAIGLFRLPHFTTICSSVYLFLFRISFTQ